MEKIQDDIKKDEEIKRKISEKFAKNKSSNPFRHDVYQPDGTRKEINSFYDLEKGASGKIHILN